MNTKAVPSMNEGCFKFGFLKENMVLLIIRNQRVIYKS